MNAPDSNGIHDGAGGADGHHDAPTPSQARMLAAVKKRETRRQEHEGEPSVARHLGQVGVLGWAVVLPTLLALYVGRLIDRHLGTGIFWTAPLMMAGLGFGCWLAWKWMHRQ
jgi:ATP synthase protein I